MEIRASIHQDVDLNGKPSKYEDTEKVMLAIKEHMNPLFQEGLITSLTVKVTGDMTLLYEAVTDDAVPTDSELSNATKQGR